MMCGREVIDRMKGENCGIVFPFRLKFGGSSNGRTVAFEAINWGSNPCPPALQFSQTQISESAPRWIQRGYDPWKIEDTEESSTKCIPR